MLVGRDPEARRVAEALDDVRSGRGAVLLLTGPPGVGKSALLHHAASTAEASGSDVPGGLTVLRATGVEFESTFAWSALHQLLRPVLGRLADLPAEQAAALRGALRLGPATGDDPFLVSLAVLTLLSVAAGGTGLVCLVDDAHWLDDQSADALRFVARRLARDPIGLLVAARDRPASRFAGDPWPRLELAGLASDGMAALLDEHAAAAAGAGAVAGGGAAVAGAGAVAGAVRERLLGYAEGNPLALLEMVAALSAAQLAGHEPLPDPLPLSAGVDAAFLDQVRRLPAEAQELLLVAACADGTAWDRVLVAAEHLGLPEAAAVELERAGLVAVAPDGVRFRHPVVRSAIVSAAPFSRRRAVHLALASAMPGEEDADRRTWHLAAACLGTDPDVADQLEAVAHRAGARSGFAAAAAALERAAELSPGAPDRARRLVAAGEAAFQAGQPERALACAARAERVAPGDRTLLGRTAALRGHLQLRQGQLDAAVGTLCAGAELVADTDPLAALELLFAAAEAAGYAGDVPAVLEIAERARRAAAPTAPARLLRDLLGGIAGVLRGEVDAGIALIRTATEGTAGLTDPRWLMWAGYGASYAADSRGMVELFEASARRARATGGLADLPLALHGIGVMSAIQGRFRAAEAAADEGVRIARETGQRTAECLNLATLAVLAALRGDEALCREYADSVLHQAVPLRLGLPVASASWALALLDLAAGRPAEALPRLRAIAEAGPGAGHYLVAVSTTPDLVEAAVRCGDPETAQHALAGLELQLANSPMPVPGAWLARCRGLVEPPATAVKHLREALRRYALTEERFERARTELLLGEALRRAKRRTDARDALRSALSTFDALGARVWAERTRRELRALGDAPASPEPDGLAALTPQELQIARLVSGGASNREIAAQLFLSPRTVEYHLYKLFPKVGVTSRTELARLVLTGAGR
jgi:DNA-binding CsgD family transcriptional regulator